MEPVIKVRYKVLSLIILLSPPLALGAFPRCEKTPHGTFAPKTEGSNGFAVSITGSPRLYRPNQMYTISLKSVLGEFDMRTKFQGFLLVAEPHDAVPADAQVHLGTFQLLPGDAMVKFSHRCSNAVEATSSISKEEIQVYWTAPPRNSGCIDFKAMVEERKDAWYEDEGSLTYTLCEDDSPLAEPPVIRPCCACNEAKYEAIFEGIWSRHTHPKDFPPDEWRTEFSQLIGASHSMNYSLWEYGRAASPALALLGERGVTGQLEQQMKRFSPSIRSVIKAHGLQQRSNLAGQTFAVFRTDPTHHLISLVSKMVPSPDWIVGLSKENLCLPDCSWVANRVIDLYPWDIGTQSGLRYDSPNMPTRPRDPIQRITSSNPNNPESPFFDETSAPMKPAARLHLIRQREYRKDCPPGHRRPPPGMNPGWSSAGGNTRPPLGGGGGRMNLNPFTQGGGASMGSGNPYGSQDSSAAGISYIYNGEGIGVPLDSERGGSAQSGRTGGYGADYTSSYNPSETAPTVSSSPDYDNREIAANGQGADGDYGRGGVGYGGQSSFYNRQSYGDPQAEDPCAVSEWGQWGACSATCGFASRNRMREFINKIGASISNCPQDILLGKEPCHGLPRCQTTSYNSGNSFDPFTVDDQQQQGGGGAYNWRGLQSGELRQAAPTSYTYGGNQGSGNRYNQLPGYRSDDPETEAEDADTESDSYSSSSLYGTSYIYGGANSNEDARASRLYDQQQRQAQNCQVSQWGEWSDCSARCGEGSRTRTRRYLDLEMSSTCMEELDDGEACHGHGEGCPQRKFARMGNFDWRKARRQNQQRGQLASNREESDSCAVAEWSNWSPCSSKCGYGRKQRTRLFRIPFVPNRKCDVQLIRTQSCVGRDQSCGGQDSVGSSTGYYSDTDSELGYDLVNPENPSYQLINMLSDDAGEETEDEDRRDHFCYIQPDEGPCNGHFRRWHYDPESESCKEFFFRGCNGNRNNFASQEKCMEVCGSRYGTSNWQANPENDEEDPFRQLKALSSIKLQEGEQFTWSEEEPQSATESPAAISCQVSAWSEWSICSATCGIGWITKRREVLIEPSIGGEDCPKKMVRKRKCRMAPCATDTQYWYQGSWRHMVSNDDLRPSN